MAVQTQGVGLASRYSRVAHGLDGALGDIPALGGWQATASDTPPGPTERGNPELADAEECTPESRHLSVPIAIRTNDRRSSSRFCYLVVVAALVVAGGSLLVTNDVGTHHALSSTRNALTAARASLTSTERHVTTMREEVSGLQRQLSIATKQTDAAASAEAQQSAEIAATNQLYASEDRYAECVTSDRAHASESVCPTTGLTPAQVEQLNRQLLGGQP